jgi:hypothetical protein
MKAAVVVTWTGVRTGRESLSLAYAREVDEHWGKLAAEGKCAEPKWFWAMNGPSYWIVEGDIEALSMLSSTPEAQKLHHKGTFILEDFGQEICVAGREEMITPTEGLISEMKL